MSKLGRFLKVKVNLSQANLEALVDALLAKDPNRVGDELDVILEFSGLIGDRVEKYDGALLDELASLILQLVPVLEARIAAKLSAE